MDIAKTYDVSPDTRLWVEFYEPVNAYQAVLYFDAAPFHLVLPPDSNHCWFETIDELLPHVDRELQARNLEFLIPEEDLAAFRDKGGYTPCNEDDFNPFTSSQENLEMLDTEYTRLIARGFNPLTDQELWNNDDVRQELFYLVSRLCQAEGEEAVSAELQQAAVRIARETKGLIPSEVVDTAIATKAALPEKTFEFLDAWVGEQFGTPLTQYMQSIDAGALPVATDYSSPNLSPLPLSKIQSKLNDYIVSIYKESPGTWIEEFQKDIKDTAIGIGKDVQLLSRLRQFELDVGISELSPKEFALIDGYTDRLLGLRISCFHELMEAGQNPITLQPMEKE